MIEEIKEKQFETILKETDLVMVDFFAGWCGPCKDMKTLLETKVYPKVKANPKIKLVKINIDTNRKLAEKYDIDSIPTIVIFYKGKQVSFDEEDEENGEKGKSVDKILGFSPEMDEVILDLIQQVFTNAGEKCEIKAG